ncbi:hypothetical protein DDB_G0283769 [Dictyostelium discoideum AX4]|uniref:HBS1-like protein n=3 Tax=Dictyostelium discoideum TaxID=44689 RepID=Q54QJ0_DICDI|nr:hypothetical protein DDB_G0283769 [Dictyostelium discoideum AX4]EAL65499.1 hypothetical protein DDB_G0283769 [Dictyostelium discoideum AX4]|eukprot:XP_638881.1 hypothetical protein DDB_G0283769 [Dictyostelium discoideum AX4]
MSRHRFLKNMDGDDFEDFKEEDDLGEYDDEVYDVYDVVVEKFPDITYPEIEKVLMDFDYNVDDAIDFILNGGLNNKGKKKNNKKPPQAVNIINNNNNNKKSEPVNTNKSTSKGQRRPRKSTSENNNSNNNSNNNDDDDDNNKNKNNNNNNKNNNGYKPSSLAQDLSAITNTISNIKIINDKEFSFQSLYKNNKDNVTNSLKTLSIGGNNNNKVPVESKTPYNTPIGTPINDKNLPHSPKESLIDSINATTVNKNLNVKQHSINRKKELEEMVHVAFSSSDNKPHLNMVVIGHVDAGKSTTMGHILFKLGYVDKRTMSKFENESNRMGKSSFHFAWVLDEQEEERERGVTMDVCVRYFETEHRRITLLDAPGHRDFIPNMISGTTQADVAILLINASEFEAGFSAEGQTKEHALLAKSLGIMELIVAVNKMDSIEWDQSRYDYIVETIKTFLVHAKFNEKNIRFIPISGFTGENLIDRQESKLLKWYDSKQPTLIECIDSFSVGERLLNKPFRMNISDVYKSSSKGYVAVGGKIEAGLLGNGDKILISPGNDICTIKSIRRNNLESEWAVGGDNVDLSLVVENPSILRVGCILSDPEKPIPLSKRFIAQIVTFTLPIPMTNGYQVVFHAHSMEEPATITRLISLLDSNGAVSKKNPRCISDTCTALVEITLGRLSCLELYSSYRQLGRFTLRNGGVTIAAGLITEFYDNPPKKSSSSPLTTTTTTTSNKK